MRKPISKPLARGVAASNPDKMAVRDDIIREGFERSAVYLNVGQDVIVVSEDRMRLQLNDLVASARRGQKWHTPIGMLLTEVVALADSNFHPFISLSPEQWDMLLDVLICLTTLWLLKTLINGWRTASVSIDGFIDSLKEDRNL